jgi:predicted phosphodiesterase
MIAPEEEERRMRVLVLSDIHANLAALQAVLTDAEGAYDSVWFLGDLVGYGPEPNECAALLRELEPVALRGNHDLAALGELDMDEFNLDAQRMIRWTQEAISEETRAYLSELPEMLTLESFTLAHASPREPVWEYILDESVAAANFAHFETLYCLVGHSHTALYFLEAKEGKTEGYLPVNGHPYKLDEIRCILNPGSVGQPRDSDPRAAYALLDTREMMWEFRRVSYPIEVTQQKMMVAGLPNRLISRLKYGW